MERRLTLPIQGWVDAGAMVPTPDSDRALREAVLKGGFDPARDLLQSYKYIEGQSPPQWREACYRGGLLADWDLKTSLEGLYATGTQMFSPEDHSYAAATGHRIQLAAPTSRVLEE